MFLTVNISTISLDSLLILIDLLLFSWRSFKPSESSRRYHLMSISFLSNHLCVYDICRFSLRYLWVNQSSFYFLLTYLLFLWLKLIVIACEFTLNKLTLCCFEMQKCLKCILKFHLHFLFFSNFFVYFKILHFHYCLYLVKCIL